MSHFSLLRLSLDTRWTIAAWPEFGRLNFQILCDLDKQAGWLKSMNESILDSLSDNILSIK